MHVDTVEVLHGPELDFQRFIAYSDIAAQNPAREAHGEFLAHFAVRVGEDVLRVRVDPHEPVGLYGQPCFFFHFAFGTLRDGLPDVHDAPGERPQSAVTAPVQEHVALIVSHDGRSAGNQRVGGGGIGVTVIISSRHELWLS